MRHYTQIHAYIAREFIFSFLVAFLFFFFIFFVNQMLLLAEEILTRRVPPWDVVRLILYSLPSIVALSFPFGSLVGALMTVGRFSSDNEVIAFQASGVPNRRLFLPLLVLGLGFSMVSFVMNDYFLPLGTIRFGQLYRRLIFSNPELELEAFTVRNYQNATVATGAVDGRRISNLIVLDTSDAGERRVIAASEASLTEPGGDAGILSLLMADVVVHSTRPDAAGDFSLSLAESMEYNILLDEVVFSLRGPGPREMASYDLWQLIRDRRLTLENRRETQRVLVSGLRRDLYADYVASIEQYHAGATTVARLTRDLGTATGQLAQEANRTITDRTLSNYELEFHKKYSIPFACLTFVVFAFPVGLMTRRSGRAVGFGIGLLVSTLYWSLLIAGQTVGINNPSISPAMAMWAPNGIILLLGTCAIVWRGRR